MRGRRAVFVAAFVVVAALSLASIGRATVWQRLRPDGTIEFTNVPPQGKSWTAVMRGPARDAQPRPTSDVSLLAPWPRAATRKGGAIWAREHSDGTIEFTNVAPVGKRWKVLFRTGPGKASAVRGSSDLVPPRDASVSRLHRYDEHIRDQQTFFGIPQALIRAIIKTESDFDPLVVSSAGAMGLMQLMPGTARAMGVTDVWDPRQNIMGGARYLQTLARRLCRTPTGGGPGGVGAGLVCSLEEKINVLAAYHAGPGAVEKHGGPPPYETTRAYVTTVLQRHEDFRRQQAALSDMVSVR